MHDFATFASAKPAAKRHHFCWCHCKKLHGIYPSNVCVNGTSDNKKGMTKLQISLYMLICFPLCMTYNRDIVTDPDFFQSSS